MPNCGFSRTAAVDHRSVLDWCQQQCLTQTTTVRNVSGHTSHVQEEECFVLPVPHSVWCTHTHGLNFSTFAMLSLLPSSVGERQTRGEEQVQQVIKTVSYWRWDHKRQELLPSLFPHPPGRENKTIKAPADSTGSSQLPVTLSVSHIVSSPATCELMCCCNWYYRGH